MKGTDQNCILELVLLNVNEDIVGMIIKNTKDLKPKE